MAAPLVSVFLFTGDKSIELFLKAWEAQTVTPLSIVSGVDKLFIELKMKQCFNLLCQFHVPGLKKTLT